MTLLEADATWSRSREGIRDVLNGLASSGEHSALGAVRSGRLVGFVLYDFVAGAVGAGVITCVVPATDELLVSALLTVAVRELRAAGARRVFAEMPDHGELGPFGEMLLGAGFEIEARIADYVADGTDLLVYGRSA